MKIRLYTKDGINCALSNEFKDIVMFKADAKECINKGGVDLDKLFFVVNNYRKYTMWFIKKNLGDGLIFENKDCFGNIQYLKITF